MTVLVLTRLTQDAVADLVINALNERSIPVLRLDPGEFPERLSMSARLRRGQTSWEGMWCGRHRDLDLGAVGAVYYRRPRPHRLHPQLPGDVARWADAEARAAVGGVLSSLSCTWVNHPWDNARAGFKPFALAEAARCGLLVPDTLITSDPEEARAFVAQQPGGVAAYKTLGSHRPGAFRGQQVAIPTSVVRAEEITDAVRLTAHQFQQWITKDHEVRLTVVGAKMFAAEIHAGSAESRIDFRRDYEALTYQPCLVPAGTAAGVRFLMRRLGLRYAAMDFLVNEEGEWYLVDLNPNGQFGFIPQLRQRITDALADLLENACDNHS